MSKIVFYKSNIISATIGMLLFWTFIVCYPNPYIFFRNFARYIRFPVNPSIMELIDTDIPDEPSEISKFVKNAIRYEYDWSNYGVPWYVPDAVDAIIRGKGDCESRAIVLASLLEAKNISYSLKASLIHIWVEYPGKNPTKSENEEIAYVGKVDGRYRLKIPDLRQWQRYVKAEREMLWDAMPGFRKIVMISGWIFFFCAGLFVKVHTLSGIKGCFEPVK